jgi:replicative DNA helicase
MSDLMEEALTLLDKMKNSGGGVTGTPSGFVDLDNQLTGFHGGELIILAARPGIGKTSLAMNFALHAAAKENMAVAVFSLEMPAVQLITRLLAQHAKVDMKKLRGGRLSPADEERISESANELFKAKFYVDDSGGLSSFDLRAKARRLKQKEGSLGLIVIDYLQLIEPDNPRDPRQEQVAKIARRLKTMSRELDIPVLCLAQLNRQAEVSRDNRPRLNHLRESGAIEQDADVVMFVHREEYYQTTDEDRERVKGQAEIIIAKQRNGPIGDIKLLWQHDFTRFVNLEHRPYDEFEQFSSF